MTHYHPYPLQPMYPIQGGEPQMQQLQYDWRLLLNAAKTGAVVAATGAAAINLHCVRKEEATWQDALTNTVKTGLTAGVATAAAAAVGQMFERHPVLSLAVTFATGTAAMYVLTDTQKEHDDE